MRLLRSTALALLLFVLTSSYLEAATTGPTPSSSASCNGMCQARCSKASLRSRCLKICGHCCAKCSCVPSGTYGNKDECPCYRDMRTNKNKPKCP